jgi:hypothetical protein
MAIFVTKMTPTDIFASKSDAFEYFGLKSEKKM